MLPEDALHFVTNPLQRFTGGIHNDGARIREMFHREKVRLGLES